MAIDKAQDKSQQAFSWAKYFGQKVVEYAFVLLGHLVSVIGKRIPLKVVNKISKIPVLNKLTSVASQSPRAITFKTVAEMAITPAISNILIKLQKYAVKTKKYI